MDRNIACANQTSTSIRKFYPGQSLGLSIGSEIGCTLVEFGVAWERLSAIFNIVFVVRRSVFAQGSAVKAVFDYLPRELQSDRLIGF
jgi:hypothetical protein